MVNILVPTDFSDLSKVAINYAIEVANKLDGNITLLHVVTVVQPTRASIRLRLEALEEELMRTAREDMESLIEEISGKIKTSQPLKYDIVKSASFNMAVKSEAKKLHVGLIVMGTHGATGLKKVMMGSSTTAVLEVSHIPVLVVPEQAEFKGIGNLIYATDLKHLDAELGALLTYIKTLRPTIHVFHMAPDENQVAADEQMIRGAIAKAGYADFKVKVVAAKELEKAVEEYIKEAEGDALVTFTHPHSLFERLFGSSFTRAVAFQSKLPLLVFRQSL